MGERVCVFGCGKPPNDDFDIGEIYWHVECYTEGRFANVVVPLVVAKMEGKKQSDYDRLQAFLAARSKMSREDAMTMAVRNVLALDPNATSDPVAFQRKVSDTFKRITGDAV